MVDRYTVKKRRQGGLHFSMLLKVGWMEGLDVPINSSHHEFEVTRSLTGLQEQFVSTDLGWGLKD